jgi:hypothetical protein
MPWVAAATALIVVLLAGFGTSTVLYLRADAAREDARKKAAQAAAVDGFLQEMLGAANPMTTRKPGLTVREALDEAASKLESGSLADQPEVEAAARTTIGSTYRFLGEYAAAEPHLQKALTIRKQVFGSMQ